MNEYCVIIGKLISECMIFKLFGWTFLSDINRISVEILNKTKLTGCTMGLARICGSSQAANARAALSFQNILLLFVKNNTIVDLVI